jgi:serine/threonine-protein kinase
MVLYPGTTAGRVFFEEVRPVAMIGSNEIVGYHVISTLGYGARSTIFAVRDRSNHVYALKRVVKQTTDDQRYLDQAIHEHEVATQFNHPALRKSLKLMKQRALIRTNEVLVLMELVDGLTLEQYRCDDLVRLCRLCQQAAAGLDAMHRGGYLHCDIKPNNILVIDDRLVKIIDFGQSCPIGTVKERIQGTPDFIAPEQVLRLELTPATDIFNLGATMYWLFTGRHVPTLIPKGHAGISLRTNDGIISPREIDPRLPAALAALILVCLAQRPSDRPATMAEVSDRLEIAINQITRTAAPADPDSAVRRAAR